MLFLLNDQILDISAALEAVNGAFPPGARAPSLYQGVALGQHIIFAAGSFHVLNSDAPARVAALIARNSEANAALFVRPASPSSPSEVAVRLASAPLTTLAWLYQHQREGALGPRLVNEHVWSLAGGANAA